MICEGGVCGGTLTLSHLYSCRNIANQQFRRHLRDAIVDLFDGDECAQRWMDQHRHFALHRLMMAIVTTATLVPRGDGDHLYAESLRMCIGAFTDAEANAAARKVGFDADSDDGKQLIAAMRVVIVDHID